MKIAATIFSWLGAAFTTIYGLVFLISGGTKTSGWLWVLWILAVIVRIIILIWRSVSIENGNKIACGVCTLLFCSIIGGILTLCIPESQLNPYSTRAPGRYPQRSSYSTPRSTSSTTYTNRFRTYDASGAPSNEPSNNKKKESYEKMLKDGLISQSTYDSMVARLDDASSQESKIDLRKEESSSEVDQHAEEVVETTEKKLSLAKNVEPETKDNLPIPEKEPNDAKAAKERETVELIKEYKQLLDDGAISQEEYDAKKKELLGIKSPARSKNKLAK